MLGLHLRRGLAEPLGHFTVRTAVFTNPQDKKESLEIIMLLIKAYLTLILLVSCLQAPKIPAELSHLTHGAELPKPRASIDEAITDVKKCFNSSQRVAFWVLIISAFS